MGAETEEHQRSPTNQFRGEWPGNEPLFRFSAVRLLAHTLISGFQPPEL